MHNTAYTQTATAAVSPGLLTYHETVLTGQHFHDVHWQLLPPGLLI